MKPGEVDMTKLDGKNKAGCLVGLFYTLEAAAKLIWHPLGKTLYLQGVLEDELTNALLIQNRCPHGVIAFI